MFVVLSTLSRIVFHTVNVCPMRIRRRSDSACLLDTSRSASSLLLALLVGALAPMLHPEPVSAASGVDDYPARLKNAPPGLAGRPVAVLQPRVHVVGRLAPQLREQGRVQRLLAGRRTGATPRTGRTPPSRLGIPVDNNPTRGAVAWWAAGSAGSSRGHVAWVQTVGDGAITIEEYNYLHAGLYDTRTISSSSSLWPSGFIHIKDTVVRNTASPDACPARRRSARS